MVIMKFINYLQKKSAELQAEQGQEVRGLFILEQIVELGYC